MAQTICQYRESAEMDAHMHACNHTLADIITQQHTHHERARKASLLRVSGHVSDAALRAPPTFLAHPLILKPAA